MANTKPPGWFFTSPTRHSRRAAHFYRESKPSSICGHAFRSDSDVLLDWKDLLNHRHRQCSHCLHILTRTKHPS